MSKNKFIRIKEIVESLEKLSSTVKTKGLKKFRKAITKVYFYSEPVTKKLFSHAS